MSNDSTIPNNPVALGILNAAASYSGAFCAGLKPENPQDAARIAVLMDLSIAFAVDQYVQVLLDVGNNPTVSGFLRLAELRKEKAINRLSEMGVQRN